MDRSMCDGKRYECKVEGQVLRTCGIVGARWKDITWSLETGNSITLSLLDPVMVRWSSCQVEPIHEVKLIIYGVQREWDDITRRYDIVITAAVLACDGREHGASYDLGMISFNYDFHNRYGRIQLPASISARVLD